LFVEHWGATQASKGFPRTFDYAPKGTPDEVVQGLNRALNSSLDDPAFRKRYAEMGRTEFTADERAPMAHKARLDAEVQRLRRLLHDAGFTPE
jgi:tripartite-type tricarboxylate transporter receptor subunit TctC